MTTLRTPAVALPAAIRAAILAHARAEAPLEACGVVAGDAPWALGGRPLRYLPLRNGRASHVAFEPDPADLVALAIALDDAGEAVWAIVHSHPRTEARPSATDLAAAADPGALHLIAGPLDGAGSSGIGAGAPALRAWAIRDGEATEVELA